MRLKFRRGRTVPWRGGLESVGYMRVGGSYGLVEEEWRHIEEGVAIEEAWRR